MEDRIIDFLPNWALWLAIAGIFFWQLIKQINGMLANHSVRSRENLALFADWQARERQAEIIGEPFDRLSHRTNFLLGMNPYQNPYDDPVDIGEVDKLTDRSQSNYRLLRALIDQSVNGIIRLRWSQDEKHGGKQLRCIYANPAAARMLMSQPKDLVDMTVIDLMGRTSLGMSPSKADDLIKRFQRAVSTRKILDTEIWNGLDSASRWTRLIAEPMRNDFVITLVNITDRKHQEISANSKIQELEDHIRELETGT